MGIVVEVIGELENFHMSREELEVRWLGGREEGGFWGWLEAAAYCFFFRPRGWGNILTS